MLTVRVTADHDLAVRLRDELDLEPTVCDLALVPGVAAMRFIDAAYVLAEGEAA